MVWNDTIFMPDFVKMGKTVKELKGERETNVSTGTKANTLREHDSLLMNRKMAKNHLYVI